MKSRKSSHGSGGAALPFFTTILVIGGVVGAAYLSSQHSPVTTSAPSAPTSTSALDTQTAVTTSSTITGPQLALVTGDGIQVVSLDGTVQSLTVDQFSHRVAEPLRPTIGADAANGTQKIFSLGTSSTSNYELAPDHRHAAHMIAPKSDGASVVDFSLHGEASQPIVLRLGSAPIRDAAVGTWANSKTVLIAGTSNGARCVYRVGVDGTVALVATLPDSAIWLAGQGTSMWYVTAQPGEGLESDPLPPSALHRVSATADDQVYADDQRVVMGVVGGTGSAYAVRLSDGSTIVRGLDGSDASLDVGKRQPVLFLADGRLILRDGFQLVVSDTAMKTFSNITTLPAGQVRIFVMPIRLDELPTKP